MIINCIFVGMGGFAGSVFRYLISLAPLCKSSGFPYNTLMINVIGSVIIGILAKEAESVASIGPNMILFLKIGLCGGFTTFSTFALESFSLLQEGKLITCGIYVVISVFLCLAGVAIGERLAG